MRQVLVHICDTPPQSFPLSILCHLNPYDLATYIEQYIYDFRDKEIVHDSCFRKQDTICIANNGMSLGYGLSYPKDTDNMKQSLILDHLLVGTL
ncbi:hypothetical protein FD724_39060 (plasmid) [Nostoc sp. C057]|nr:hypothetical protein FD724_39060 [Nostoc sp. C057]